MGRGAQTISLDPKQSAGLRARQRFAPSAIQGLEVLSLPIAALAEYATTMVEQNPLLDLDYDESFLTFEELPLEYESPLQEKEEDEERSEPFDFVLPSCSSERNAFDMNRLHDDCVETETLKSYLRLQIADDLYDEKQKSIVQEIIESIDDDGYFSGNESQICSQFQIEAEVFVTLLNDVQSCSPRGVAARNLNECLLLQIDESFPYYPVLSTLLSEDLDVLASHKTALLLKKYHLSHDALLEIRDYITTLNPRPGAMFYQQQKTNYVIPDLIVKAKSTGFTVEVTGEVSETLVLNEDYLGLLEGKRVDNDTARWLEAKHEEARMILRNINQRKQTLYRFGLLLVEAQYDFFRFGEARLKPLTMQQVADVLRVHVSTISRTVQDKYVLTPWGTYPLKFFFCSSLACTQSEKKTVLSSLAIKSRIKELISTEDKQKPYSDASLMELLNKEGVEIKRRTVAKYREALGIEKQSQRRW